MNDLDIIYCKNCKHYIEKVINKHSIFYACNKGNIVEPTKPDLYCNRKCYMNKNKKEQRNGKEI